MSTPDLPEIVQRYTSGESLQTIARELSVHRATLYNWMMDGQADTDYHALVTKAMITRIAEADETLEQAHDQIDIARAREKMRFTRMDLERRRPHLYGPKQQIQEDKTVTIIINRKGNAGETQGKPLVSNEQQPIEEAQVIENVQEDVRKV